MAQPAMSPLAVFGCLPAALRALHLHIPAFLDRRPSPASRLSARLVPLSRDPRREMRSVVRRALNLEQELDNLQRPTLTGVWRKDRDASDDMREACDLVALPWVLRQALAVLNRLEVEESATHFVTNLKAGGLMDVVERYPFSGEPVEHSRRDKRRGKHVGRVSRTSEGRHPCIEVSWDDPHGGVCADTFVLSADGDTLTQLTEMRIAGGGTSAYKTVFRRVRSGPPGAPRR